MFFIENNQPVYSIVWIQPQVLGLIQIGIKAAELIELHKVPSYKPCMIFCIYVYYINKINWF